VATEELRHESPSSRSAASRATELVIDKLKPSSPKMLRTFMARAKTVAKDALPATQVARLVPKWALTPTVARRSYACLQLILHELNRGGLDLFSLQQAMGHGRLDVTERHLSDVLSYLQRVQQADEQRRRRTNDRRDPARPGRIERALKLRLRLGRDVYADRSTSPRSPTR
jgi:hypothetical protein